jgi:hypothetical protein
MKPEIIECVLVIFLLVEKIVLEFKKVWHPGEHQGKPKREKDRERI